MSPFSRGLYRYNYSKSSYHILSLLLGLYFWYSPFFVSTKFYYMTDIEYWNNLSKPKEVDVVAEKDDLVVEIGGILYLLQINNGFNNVVCFRLKKSKMTILQSFLEYRKWLIIKGVEYIRVEGNKKRYWFLARLNPGAGYNVVQDIKECERNVFYIKLY